MGPAALALRVAGTLAWLRPEIAVSAVARVAAVAGLWLALCVAQPPLSYALRLVAHSYVHYRNSQSGGKGVRVIGGKKHV